MSLILCHSSGREQGAAQSIFEHPGRRHELAIQTPSPGQRLPLGSTRFRSHTTRLGGFRLHLRHRTIPRRMPITACPAASPLNPSPTAAYSESKPMASERQIDRNRRNSQKSRYPLAHLPVAVPPRLGHGPANDSTSTRSL